MALIHSVALGRPLSWSEIARTPPASLQQLQTPFDIQSKRAAATSQLDGDYSKAHGLIENLFCSGSDKPRVRFPQTYVSFSASHSTAMTPHIAEGMKLPQEVLDMIIGHLLGCIDLLDVWKPQKGLFPVFLPKICFAGDKRWLRASIEHLLKNAIVQPRRDYDIEWFTYWLGSAGLRHVRKLGFPNFTRRTHDYEARKTTYEFPTNIELAMRCPNLEHLTITFYADHLFSRPIYDDTWEEPRKLSKVIEEFELHRLCHLPKLRYLRMLCMSTRWIEENSAGPWSALALLKGWFVEQFERKKVEVSAGLIYPRRLRRY